MELALLMACLTIIVLVYGFSIERAKTLEARRTINTLLEQFCHCRHESPPTLEEARTQSERPQTATSRSQQ